MQGFWEGFEKRASTRWLREQVAALGRKIGDPALTPKRLGHTVSGFNERFPYPKVDRRAIPEAHELIEKNLRMRLLNKSIPGAEFNTLERRLKQYKLMKGVEWKRSGK